MRLVLFLLFPVLCSCTVSLTLANTHGEATDVVDSEAKSSTDVDPTLSIPVSPL